MLVFDEERVVFFTCRVLSCLPWPDSIFPCVKGQAHECAALRNRKEAGDQKWVWPVGIYDGWTQFTPPSKQLSGFLSPFQVTSTPASTLSPDIPSYAPFPILFFSFLKNVFHLSDWWSMQKHVKNYRYLIYPISKTSVTANNSITLPPIKTERMSSLHFIS